MGKSHISRLQEQGNKRSKSIYMEGRIEIRIGNDPWSEETRRLEHKRDIKMSAISCGKLEMEEA